MPRSVIEGNGVSRRLVRGRLRRLDIIPSHETLKHHFSNSVVMYGDLLGPGSTAGRLQAFRTGVDWDFGMGQLEAATAG